MSKDASRGRWSARWVLWLAFLFAIPSFPSFSWSEERVLLLSSFAVDDHLLEPVIDGVRERLSTRSGLRIQIEHLDVEHDVHERHLESVEYFLTQKYADAPLDAIIVLGEAALSFALRARGSIINDAPIIFGGVAGLEYADANSLPGVTGVLTGHELAETLTLMLALDRQRTNIFIVDDNSAKTARSIWLRRSMRKAQIDFADEFEFRDSFGMTMADLEEELSALGPEDVVFYLSFTEDAAGQNFSYLDALGRVSRASSAPVYGALEGMAGYGVVGGYMLSLREIGLLIGLQLVQVLDGGDPDQIPLVREAPHRFVFDFRQMQRFGITSSQLPKDSMIIDEPDTFYYHYKQYFFAAFAVFLGMVGYIFVLLSGIAKREKARRGLEALISGGEHPLPIQQPVSVLKELAGRLTSVVPHLDHVSFYRTPGGLVSDKPLEQVDIGGSGMARPRPDLAKRVGESGRNQFGDDDALLVLDSDSIPADLAYCRASGKLDAVDQRMIDLLARNVLIECDNIHAARLTSSLETAAQIQDAILPKNFAEISDAFGVDLYATIRPAREVGGDLYDFFAIGDKLCVLVGDVSDKGVPAALFMSITRSLIRALSESESDPKTILQKANAILSAENPNLMFVTLFFAVIDTSNGRVDYVNAGHNAPLIRLADGRVEIAPVESNIALGVFEAAEFVPQTLTLPDGATFLLYTDGVSEAENVEPAQFGETRLIKLLEGAPNISASETVGRVLTAVDAFAGEAPQFDDITIFAVGRNGGASHGGG